MRLIRLLKRDLGQEISSWVDDNIITREQAQALYDKYDIDTSRSSSTGYRLLVSLGYLFIGLALITLLGANWEEIPRALRMAGLVAITLGTHGLGLQQYIKGNVPAAAGLFFLGNLFYGASIILIAQIYHLGEHMPDGVFWWALGSLPFGLLLRNAWLTLFSLALAMLWFTLEFSMDFFPTIFPLFILSGFYALIKDRTNTLLFVCTVVSIFIWVEALLAFFWSSKTYRFDLHSEHLFVSVALFLFAYSCSYWLSNFKSSKWQDYGAVLSLWTLRFALVVMLIFSYEGPWKELLRAKWHHQLSMWFIITFLFAGVLYLSWRFHKLSTTLPLLAFTSLAMVSVILVNDSQKAIFFQAVFNIVLVATCCVLIVKGIQNGISHYFFLGVATILLVGLMRYFDLVGDYIGGAILFIVMAIVLLSAAKYWKSYQQRTTAT